MHVQIKPWIRTYVFFAWFELLLSFAMGKKFGKGAGRKMPGLLIGPVIHPTASITFSCFPLSLTEGVGTVSRQFGQPSMKRSGAPGGWQRPLAFDPDSCAKWSRKVLPQKQLSMLVSRAGGHPAPQRNFVTESSLLSLQALSLCAGERTPGRD